MKRELQSLILLLALLVVGTSPSLAYFTYWKYSVTAKDNGQETDGGNYTFRYDSEDSKGNFMDFRTHTMFDAQKDMYKWGWYIRANYGSVGNDNITIVTVTLEDGDGYKHDIAEAELVGYQEPKVKWSERPVYFSSLKSSGDFKYMFSLEYQPTETDIEENVKRVFICCKTEWKGGKNVRYFQYERDIDLSSLKESASKYSCEQDDAGNLVFKVSGVPKAAKNSDRYLERYFCGEVLYLGGYNYFKETVKFSLTDANYTGGTDSEANYTFTIPVRWYTMSMRLLHLRYVVEAKRQTQGYEGDDRYSYVMKAVDDDTYNSGILFKPYTRPDKITVEFDKWNKRNIVQWTRATQVEELMNHPKQNIDCRTDGTWYVLRYEIDREPSSYEVIKEVSGSSTNLKVEDTTIDYDKEYVYRVVFLPQLLKSTFADKLVNLPGEIFDLWEEASVETTMEVPIELAQDRTCDTSVRLVWDYCVKGTGYDWSIDYRPAGETTWRTLNETIPVDINESRASFDASGTVCDLIEYRVKINVAGKDYCSNIVTTNLPTGSYISEVKASTGTEEKTVFVKWKVARADLKNDIYYRVLRRAVGAEEWTLLTDQIHGTASEYTYTDDRPLAGSYYEYTVEAYEAKCADQLIKTDAVIAPGFSQARGTITGHVAFGTGTPVAGARINLIKSAADGSSQDPQFLSRHLEGEGKGLQWRAASDVFAKVFDGGKPLTLQLWAKPFSDGDSQMALLNIPGALELGVKRIGNTSGYVLQLPDDESPLGSPVNTVATPSVSRKAYTVTTVEQGAGTSNDSTALWQLYAVDLTTATPKVKEFPALTFSSTDFTHVAAVYDGASAWTFYVGTDTIGSDGMTVGNKQWTAAEPVMGIGGSNRVSGSAFKGNVDDIRLWNSKLTVKAIETNYTRILGGTEEGLVLYWPLDEGLNVKSYAFDISCQDGIYQLNHPEVGVNALPSTEVPQRLALYGMTDAEGDYIIKGIPFQQGGTNYKLAPELGIHEFSPTTRSMFVSPTSLTANNIDFEDVSSFPMEGYIYYAGTNIPAKDIQLYIDGELVTANGQVATTDDNGHYLISVPIGKHFVQAKQTGHTMVAAGRFPHTGTYDFNRAVTYNFTDSTLVNYVGRVAGGEINDTLAVGFASSKNNIGVATITMKLSNESFSFNCQDDHITAATQNRTFDSDTTAIKSHTWTGFGSDSKYIYIQTDSVTGEFSALLPPLKYLTKNIEVKSNKDIEFINMPEVDLTTVIKSQKDSLTTITANGDSVKSYYTYNTKSVYTYYAPPQLELRQRNNPKGAYGVQELTGVEDDFGTADITDIWHTDEETGEVSYRFQYPVYKMQDKYYYDIRGYEAYTNYDASPVVTDTIPMKAQILSIKNEMTSDQQIAYRVEDPEALGLNVGDVVDLKSDEIMLDAAGRASYSWTCGYPTLVSPYTRHLGINYVRKNRTYVWPGIDGIVLGALPTGNNFVTLGPDRPTQVLRDPPGANSKTTWKTGKTTTKLRTHANGFSGDDKAYVELIWGAELSIGAGLGLMIMSSTKNDVQSKVGVHVLVDKGSSTEETWTTTTTQEVSTNATPYYVGFNGDVFIGASTNLIFGTCRKVGLFRESASGDYGIRQVDAMSLGDSVRTTFMFSQQEIELNQIPNWKKLRKDLFIHVDTKEEAMNYPADPYEPLYVTWLKEGDAEYGDTATYNWIKPVNAPENCKSDSILWLTNQIRLWEQVLSDNEQDKVEAMKGTEYFSKNISFDSGAPNGYSERLDTTYTRKHNYSYTARAIVGYRSGIGVTSGSKFGANISVETENGGYNSWVDSDPNENYKNYAELDYSFADANPATHLSVNVYKSPSGWSDIFSVFGGQTYCPYEGEVRTRYYEKDKHVLSNATVQMDKPTLRISSGDGLPAQSVTLSDVPCGTSALFKLHLSNASDSGSDMYYALAPAEASNTMGLQLLVDGLSLASGRSIMVPAGTTVEKTLEVRQTDISVLDYKDVKLKLTSVCQNAENGFFPPIKDEVSLDVHFKPISSAIDMVIADPILNTDNKEGKLAVRLTNFNRQFQHLKNVGLQYRFEGNTQWTNLHTWATDKADTTSAGVSLLPASGDLRYEVDMSDNVSYPEGAYQFRACTTTPYGDEMVSTYSQVVDVVKDMTRPRNLTTPSPATGILHYGDELSLEFNEDIVPGYVSSKNVIITAKLNSRQLTHETALQLQPYGDVPVTVNPIFLDGDFAMDFWLRWHDSGTVLQQGDYNPNFALNIDDAGHLVANIAGTMMTSKATLPKDEWIFFALNYKASTMTFDILAQYGDHNVELFKNQPITPTDVQVITNTGDNYIYLGGIHADMHALSLYNISHDVYDAAATKYQAKDNYVYGLANYWPMDEGHGEIAHDTRHTHDFSVTDQWTRDNVNYSVRIDNEQGLKTDITRIGTTPGDSYAIELWQKISSAVNQQTVFETATPTVDGDLLPASAKIRLHYDAAKNLVLDYGTKSQVVASKEDFPDPYVWRHMALNVVRGQAASFYINGQRTAVIAEADVPPLQGTTLLVGRNDNLTYVDELRIWHASLSESRLQNNIYNTIDTADVYARGLAAYYPFEKTGTVNGVTTKVQTMENMAKTALSGKSETITSEGEYMPVKFVPPLKNAPEETRLVASTVASERKVVINLTGAGISPRDIEGTTLNITVDQVHDLHGNTSLPIRWTAYVQQNTLDWTRDSVNIVKMYGDSYTFDVIIENKSGNTEYYTLYNMPQWLTVDGSATSDDIAPLSTKVLRFQVNPLVPVGNYDVTIGLQGNKQILEPLRVVMKVRGETPAWTVDPTQYEHQMTYIGQVRIGGILMENSESLVAAFIDGECRGVASPEKVRGAAYVTMTVYGSGYEGEDLNKPVKFRIWDASTGMAYTDVNCTTHDGSAVDNTFSPDKVNGSYDDPVIWTKGNKVEQLLKLNTMWNWVALGVAPADKRPVAVFPELTEWKTFIKDKNSTMIFSNGVEWRPNNVSIEPATMYKVKIVATKADQKLPEQLPVTGEQLVLSETPVTVKNGWNWIAYTPMTTMPLGQALAGVNPKAGDCVKSQRGIAFYNRMNGWEGSLKALESGHGYMYNSMDTQQKSFCYPEPTAASRMQSQFLAPEAPCHIFTPVGGTDYPDNMTMVILLRNGDQTIDTCEVAAFIDNECRGATRANGGLYYLMIAGEGSGQQIEVRTCIDGDIVSIDNSQKYTTDQIIGTPWEPYVIDLSALVTGIADMAADEEDDADWWTLQGFKIGRRPTRAGVYIHHGKKETVKVRR